MNRINNKRKKTVGLTILSILIMILFMFPLYWTIITSFKHEIEIFEIPPTLFPKSINFSPYSSQVGIGSITIFDSFKNSMIIAVGAMIISLLLSIPASYALGRFKFRGDSIILMIFLITQMMPSSVLLSPLFLIFKKMGILNTRFAVILADATIGIPFTVLVLKNYFNSVPVVLEESAMIDGCTRFQSFYKIFLPIVKPGIIVSAIFSFLYAWGDLAYGMTLIQSQSLRPMTSGIFNYIGQYGTRWSYLTAFATITILPVLIIFITLQKYIIEGMIEGAVKG